MFFQHGRSEWYLAVCLEGLEKVCLKVLLERLVLMSHDSESQDLVAGIESPQRDLDPGHGPGLVVESLLRTAVLYALSAWRWQPRRCRPRAQLLVSEFSM